MKKPCSVPWKIASTEDQELFVKNLEIRQDEALKNNNVVLFCDACHIIHNTIIKSLWQLKWDKFTMKIKANSWRDRRNVLWVLELNSSNIYTKVFGWSCNSEVFMEFLYDVRQKYKDKKYIDIVLDNARYQKSKEVLELAEILDIRLIFLPPYTPNLNTIEKLWKRLKSKLSNVYNEKSAELYEYICDIFRKSQDIYRDEILQISNTKTRIINSI